MPLRPGVTKDQALDVLISLKEEGDELWQNPPVEQEPAEGFYLNVKNGLLPIYTATSPELKELDDSFWQTIAFGLDSKSRYRDAVHEVTIVLEYQRVSLQRLEFRGRESGNQKQ